MRDVILSQSRRMIALVRRFASLERSQRRLVLEAATLLVVVRNGLRLLRFLTLRRILHRSARAPLEGVGSPDPVVVESVRWAIAAAAARLSGTTCLVQALAADTMLRRRGIASDVRFGVRVGGIDAPVEGHAWVECGDGVTIGESEPPSDFQMLTSARSEWR